jgi:hypothetical protein
MRRIRRAGFPTSGVLLVLLGLAIAQAIVADTASITRFIVFSWDSPATLVVDELASQATSYSDPGRQTARHLEAVRLVNDRAPSAEASGHWRNPCLRSCITRAPPAA